ncbi:DNA-binding response regulator, OmpR family, contains REC and winged-helix (wHTH) domain [Amycolatopsis marina]|uniref:DNA-binding response regulator, OmpR family, contains REC and winged-helix (WHTH) domain n=1 Tax=Amycolatopsis marina TaxID=490629 RepID=A0A1I0V849_9PSEU|nr:response regulator transcription factor [Amycolatopsis marina]SFA72217.1 DNA-binding response regulator, OmpR family, contains REC and winged-helix (wHTH) domain [Amycolatopsis marina]
MRLLIVEDEQDLAGALHSGLTRAGYAVDLAPTGRCAWEKAQVHRYDVIVLDLNLPDIDGLELCGQLRADQPEPAPRILMLTARGSMTDRVRGLDQGADDYLVKPFALAELLARIRALLRRDVSGGDCLLRVGELEMDTARMTVNLDGSPLALTRKEFSVLRYLMSRPGQVVGAEELLEHVWDEHANPFTETVRVTVGTLRRKLKDACPTQRIDTVIGRGYRLVDA